MPESVPEQTPPTAEEAEALARYREALTCGLSDAEAREEGWPTVQRLTDEERLDEFRRTQREHIRRQLDRLNELIPDEPAAQQVEAVVVVDSDFTVDDNTQASFFVDEDGRVYFQLETTVTFKDPNGWEGWTSPLEIQLHLTPENLDSWTSSLESAKRFALQEKDGDR